MKSLVNSVKTFLWEARRKLDGGDKFQSLVMLRDVVEKLGTVALLHGVSFKTYRIKCFLQEVKRLDPKLYDPYMESVMIGDPSIQELKKLIEKAEAHKRGS